MPSQSLSAEGNIDAVRILSAIYGVRCRSRALIPVSGWFSNGYRRSAYRQGRTLFCRLQSSVYRMYMCAPWANNTFDWGIKSAAHKLGNDTKWDMAGRPDD